MTEPGNILREFALDASGTSVLVTYQDWLIVRDIIATKHGNILGKDLEEVKESKTQWHLEWRELVENSFSEIEAGSRPRIWGKEDPGFKEGIESLRSSPDRLHAGLVLLELAAFEAYWPFNKEQKQYKGLDLVSDTHKAWLEQASCDLGFEPERASELRDEIESAQKAISHFWYKLGIGVLAGFGLGALAFGIAAPFIGGLIGGAMGLSGAVATNAGLAALGGGSVAAGGFGIAGGMTVVVGGGALLGVGVGAGGGRIVASMTSETALLSSAKLEVILREFILQGQRDTAMVQEVLFAQRKTIEALEEEVDRLRLAGKTSDERLKELEKSIKLIRTAHERNMEMASR